MQFKNIVAAAALAASASALPAAQDNTVKPNEAVEVPSDLKTFGLIAIRSGSPLQNQGLTASKGSLWIGHKQDANCFEKTSDFATFLLNTTSQEMFLYNTTEISKQQFYCDRSGMGQGVLQYSNGESSTTGARLETKGFAINENSVLQFDGDDFVACPYGDSETEYTVWIDVGLTNPGYNPRNCTGFIAKEIETTDPVGCYYTN
ncbi:hypothetical protein HDK64DRAFT_113946 [Phyllosticta capitalensis]